MLLRAGVKFIHLAHIFAGLSSAEIPVFAHRVVIYIRIRLHEQRAFNLSVPLLRVKSKFLCYGYSVENMGNARIVGGNNEFLAFFRIRDFRGKSAVERRDDFAAAAMFGSFCVTVVSLRPYARATLGISCMMPFAPAHDTTVESNLLSQ